MTKSTNGNLEGVQIVPKKKILDDRGAIFHMLRADDKEFQKFGEIYFSQVKPGIVKGWHYHTKMTLNYFLVYGSIRLALYDERKDSSTFGKLQEILMSEDDSKLVVVPTGIWNGFIGLGKTPSLVANCSTIPHDPNEILRKPHDDPFIKYNWSAKA